jgi:ribosomal protein S18 acetylase RimI-like enzyme
MEMELVLAKPQDALVLASISKRAFDSDVEVGGTQPGGPPGYQSQNYHAKMAAQKHLYTFYDNGLIVGGAILFKDGTNLYIGRIFIAPEHFRKGLGTKLMEMIENLYPDVTSFTLDTPLWNIRTNSFYQKLGYKIEKKDKEFAYYIKRR